jgi:succinate-semialdehyde dehydrogenase/glutarate-semialdehyde dehydrogenase
MENLIDDALSHGAEAVRGGRRGFNKGYFFEPTVLLNVPSTAKAMNEEPFGPLALISSFKSVEDAFAEANRLPFGLASYAYTRSMQIASALSERVEAGMMSVNHYGLAHPELPFGGVKESGYGSEGGLEAVEAYLTTKFVSQASA